MTSNDSNLPPHWLAADDQMRAELRESRQSSRDSQERMWRRAGHSEAQIAQKMQERDQRVSAMDEAMQSAVEDRAPSTASPGSSSPQSPQSPPETPVPPEPPKPRREQAPVVADGLVRSSPPRLRREPVEGEFEPLPGRASRWLTGYYRYAVGVVAGTAVALVAWLALQLVGVAFLGMTMWSWPVMLLAGFLPAVGLLWWVSEVHREVRHYIDFAGRVPVRFRRW